MLAGQSGAHVGSRPAVALVEEQEEPVVFADQHVVVVGHPAEAVEQQPGDVTRLRLALQRDAERPAGHRTAAVGADGLIAAVAIRADVAVLHADTDFDVLARHTRLRLEST